MYTPGESHMADDAGVPMERALIEQKYATHSPDRVMIATIREAATLSAYIEMATSSVANGQMLIDQLRSLARCIGYQQSAGSNKHKRCDDCPGCGDPKKLQALIKQLSEEIPFQTELVAKITGSLNTFRAQKTPPQSPSDPQDTIIKITGKPGLQELVQIYQADVQNAEVLIRYNGELESEVYDYRTAAGMAPTRGRGGRGGARGRGGKNDAPAKAPPAQDQAAKDKETIKKLRAENKTLKDTKKNDTCPEELKDVKEKYKAAKDYIEVQGRMRAVYTLKIANLENELENRQAGAPGASGASAAPGAPGSNDDCPRKLKDTREALQEQVAFAKQRNDECNDLRTQLSAYKYTPEEIKNMKKAIQDEAKISRDIGDVCDKLKADLKACQNRGTQQRADAQRKLDAQTLLTQKATGERDILKEELSIVKGSAGSRDKCPKELAEATVQLRTVNAELENERARCRNLNKKLGDSEARVKSLQEGDVMILEEGENKCQEQLKQARTDLRFARGALDKTKEDLEKEKRTSGNLNDKLRDSEDRVRELQKRKYGEAVGGDDDCQEDLKRTQKLLSDVRTDLVNAKQRVEREKGRNTTLTGLKNAAQEKVRELEAEKRVGAAGGDDDCQEELKKIQKDLGHAKQEIEKLKRTAGKKQAGSQTVISSFSASEPRARVRPLEGDTGEAAVGSDDDCPEQLKRTQQELNEATSKLERTQRALEAAQHNSNQEDGRAAPDSDNFNYDASWAAGMAELRRYINDRDEVVSNSEGAQVAIENIRQAMSSNLAAHEAEVKKLQETIAEQREKIKSLEAELALQGQTPPAQEQSLKNQIKKLKEELKDCQRKIASGADDDDSGDDDGASTEETEAGQIRRKDKEFEVFQKLLTHGVYHRPDYDCEQRIKQLRERLKAEVESLNAEIDRREIENEQLLGVDYVVSNDEVFSYEGSSDETTDSDIDESQALQIKLKKAEAKRRVAEKRLNAQKLTIAKLQREKSELEKKEKDCVEQYAALKEKVLREEGAKEAEGAGGAEGVVDPEAVQGQDAELADKLKKAENARQNAEYTLEFTREELAKALKDLKSQTKKREECDEKYKYLKEIDNRRTREEEEARKEARRQPPGAGPGPMTPVTPGTGTAGPSHDQNKTLPPDDDFPMDDGPGPGPGPDYEAEIEALNHQIIQLEGRITAFESAAGNDQEQIEALRSGSKCNKKLLANIDKLRKELAELQKQLDECRNETWQERRRRLRLAAAANRRPRGTVPPRANRRLDPALQQQQEWAENGWWNGQDDIGPERKRRKTKK